MLGRIWFTALFFIVSLPAESLDLVLERANQNFFQRRFEDAVRDFQTVLQQDPTRLSAYEGLVRTLLEHNKVEEAEEVALRAAQTFADHSVPDTLRGDVHFRKGRFGDATRSYAKAISRQAAPARAYLGLGRVLWTECRRKTACGYFQKAYESDPNDPEILGNWAACEKDTAVKLALYEKYVAAATYEEPEYLERWKSWIDIRRQLGELETFRLDHKPQKTEIKLRPVKLGPQYPSYGLRLTVTLNGKQKEDFLLDTGANGVLISRKAAEKAGVKRLGDSTIRGIGEEGYRKSYFGWADSLAIGDLEFKDCLVTASDRKYFGSSVSGIIGPDVFSEFLIGIDYKNLVLQLSSLPPVGGVGEDKEAWINYDRTIPAEMEDFASIRIVGGKLLIPVLVNNKREGNFLIDSGASDTFLSQRLAREVSKLGSDYRTVKGISGKVKDVKAADQVTLQFDQYRQQNRYLLTFDFSDLSKNMETEIDGLLGHPVLQHFVLLINYRDGLVDFVYNGP